MTSLAKILTIAWIFLWIVSAGGLMIAYLLFLRHDHRELLFDWLWIISGIFSVLLAYAAERVGMSGQSHEPENLIAPEDRFVEASNALGTDIRGPIRANGAYPNATPAE